MRKPIVWVSDKTDIDGIFPSVFRYTPSTHCISGNVERTIRSKNADLFDRLVLRVRLLFHCFSLELMMCQHR